jgi:hypothetical protein
VTVGASPFLRKVSRQLLNEEAGQKTPIGEG